MKASSLDLLVVFMGGGLGAIARWLLSAYVQEKTASPLLPWGTLTVNAAGSFLIGFVMGAYIIHGVFGHESRLFLATGFAGAFTTFSTFMYESLRLMAESSVDAAGYIAATLILGLVLVYAGYVVAGFVYR